MATGGSRATDVHVRGGVETLTVTDASPGAELEVRDASGRAVVTLVADEAGNAHLAFLPPEPRVLATMDDKVEAISTGSVLAPGDYEVLDRATGETHPVHVLAVDEVPDPALYDQELTEGFGYLTVRDGVQLSVMVRFPNEALYGPAPWPTVVEYSGYDPSNPDGTQPSSILANLLGFAVVGVNIRGTGCSGGVFDVFSPAQAADGYDVIETVARQPWVLHGRVGMVGLSYPGITQLYVAAQKPPHLAAIAPLSVIDCLWRQQWPGGVYNAGFTRAWVAARDAKAKQGGMLWDAERIAAGDEVARENQRIRSQNFDFERFAQAIPTFRPMLEDRRIGTRVHEIEVPVYMTGAWQDEQTGGRFATMIGAFDSSPDARATVFNGHHPDGYSPMVVMRWYEFLSFHVARRIPRLPDIVRQLAPRQFVAHFGYEASLEPDRFTHHGEDVDAALAEYLAEPRLRIIFENGAGHEVLSAAAFRYEAAADSFPPAGVEPQRLHLAPGERLVLGTPTEPAEAVYEDDPEAGALAYSRELLGNLNRFTLPDVPVTWTHFASQHRARFDTEPLAEPMTIAGWGHVELWLRPGTEDTAVQATLTELRPDGYEQRIQSGWHRPIHRQEDRAHSDDLRVEHTFRPEDVEPLVPGRWIHFRLPIHPVAHVLRAGSRLRLTLSTPGRDHPFWCFDNPVEPGATHAIGLGGEHPSALVLPFWPQGVAHPEDHPPAGSLRGQPTRPVA